MRSSNLLDLETCIGLLAAVVNGIGKHETTYRYQSGTL
jgi:hypothetical protein